MMKIFREMFGDLEPWGQFWLALGLITLAAAAGMSFKFGWSVSILHALFLGCLTVVAAFLPEAAYRQWQMRKYGVALGLVLVAIPCFVIEFYSHAGYTAGLRGENIETASVQNAKYDDRRNEVTEGKTNLAMWEKRLKDLETENAWVASVTADALRARLASANLAIDLEAKRGGCKARCLERTRERDDIASKIALAEEKGDLTAKIEATKRVLATARDKSAATEHKSSAVAHQNEFLARAVALVSAGSLSPDDYTKAVSQESVNIGMAYAGTGLPALALFIAALYRRRGVASGSGHGLGGSLHANGGSQPMQPGGTQAMPHGGVVVMQAAQPAEPQLSIIEKTFSDKATAKFMAQCLKDFAHTPQHA